MATIKTDRQQKLIVVVNTGTTESPTLKNRPIGTGYWINPNSDSEKLYTLGGYFGALQAHTIAKITGELKYMLEEE